MHSGGIKLPDDQQIKEVEIDKGFKYLGIFEADGVKEGDMKEKVVKEHYRRIRKILKSKLNGAITITAIN